MSTLNDFYITFKPKSPLISQLHSDTIFGHIAWAIRYLWGEKELKNFLNAFKDGSEAPFLISDGFPNGKLPKPFAKALPLTRVVQIIVEVADELKITIYPRGQTQILKALKKQSLIGIATFKKIQANYSAEVVLKESVRELDWDYLLSNKKKSKRQQQMAVMHNTVNRIYNTVTEGLFQQTEYFYPEDFLFDVYVKTSYFDERKLNQIFEIIQYIGFGRDKSTGKGKFEIMIQKRDPLPKISSPSGFMVISHYIPNSNSPTIGYYRLMTKYGRLGGEYACSVIPGIKKYYGGKKPKVHPFKKPLLMIRPGSVFWGEPKLSYGMLLGGEHRSEELRVHKFPAIRHYGYAYPVGLKVAGKEFAL